MLLPQSGYRYNLLSRDSGDFDFAFSGRRFAYCYRHAFHERNNILEKFSRIGQGRIRLFFPSGNSCPLNYNSDAAYRVFGLQTGNNLRKKKV